MNDAKHILTTRRVLLREPRVEAHTVLLRMLRSIEYWNWSRFEAGKHLAWSGMITYSDVHVREHTQTNVKSKSKTDPSEKDNDL